MKELAFLFLWAFKAKFGERLFREMLPILGMRWVPVKSPFELQSDIYDDAITSWEGTIYSLTAMGIFRTCLAAIVSGNSLDW